MDAAPAEPAAPARRRAPLGARLLLALVTALLLLVPLELLARREYARRNARLWTVDTSRPPADMRPERLRIADIIRAAAWRDLVYDLQPSMEGRFLGAGYSTNGHGMRDRELAQAKPADEYRIALIGDSYSFGWGCEAQDGYADVLEGLLAGAVPGKRVEVLNFGVPGYNTAIEAACLERKALAFHPDLVLVQFYFNDLFMPDFLLREPEPPLLCAWDWARTRLGGKAPAVGLQNLAAEQGFEATRFADWRRDPARVPEEFASMVGEEGVRRAMRRIADAAAAARIPVALLIIEVPTQAILDRPPAPLPEPEPDRAAFVAGRELGFTLIPTLQPLTDHLRENKLAVLDFVLSDKDRHPNAEGHRFLAGLVAEALSPLMR